MFSSFSNFPLSIYFFALPQAPPVLEADKEICIPDVITPTK
jgi:hypothetical protein